MVYCDVTICVPLSCSLVKVTRFKFLGKYKFEFHMFFKHSSVAKYYTCKKKKMNECKVMKRCAFIQTSWRKK